MIITYGDVFAVMQMEWTESVITFKPAAGKRRTDEKKNPKKCTHRHTQTTMKKKAFIKTLKHKCTLTKQL